MEKIKIHSFIDAISLLPQKSLITDKGWSFEVLPSDNSDTGLDSKTKALMELAPEIEYYIANIVPLTEEFFRRATRLKAVFMFGSGLEHIDLKAATKQNVIVTNAPGANASSVAELNIAMMFSLARKVIPMHNALLEKGLWKPMRGTEVSGKTLGIIGFGAIGTALAKMSKALGLSVLFYNRSNKQELAATLGCKQIETIDELIPQADYLALCLPAQVDHNPIIGKKEIAMMQKHAFLLNTSRGSLVDLDALAEAISKKEIAGAGLDVYPTEPLTTDIINSGNHPISSLSNVVCTPHVGSSTDEAILNVTKFIVADLELVLQKKCSSHTANKDIYSKLGWNQ